MAKLDYLGTATPEADEVLQELVDEVRAIFGTDLCMVNLILSDVQYFRVWSGELPEDLAEARQVPRERSMCRYVVEAEAPLVVENFLATEEFSNQYFCVNYGVRFYAGAPLATSDGHAVGTLCLLDAEPKEFGEEQMRMLRAFARAAVGRLEVLGALNRERAARDREARRSRELQRTLDTSLDLITTIGPDGTFKSANSASTSMLGYEPEELIGRSYRSVVHPDDRGTEPTDAATDAGGEARFENRCLRKDGGIVWVEWRVVPLTDEGTLHCVGRDITQRKRAEAERSLLAAIVESSDDAIIGKTLDGTITSWNRGAQRLYGYSAEETIGRPISMLVPPDRADEVSKILQALRRGEGLEHFETVRMSKDGNIIDVSLTISPVKDSGDNIVGASTIARDITERKSAEERLRHAEEKYRGIFENAVEGIFRTLPDGRLVEGNPAMGRMLGYGSPEEMRSVVHDVGKQLWVDPAERARFLRAARERDTVSGYEARMRRKDGSAIWVSMNSRAIKDPDGRVVALEGTLEDVTERKQAEEALRNQLELNEAITSSLGTGIFALDLEGRVTFANLAAERVLGWTREEVVGKDVREIVRPRRADGSAALPEADQPLAAALGVGEDIRENGGFFTRKDGKTIPVVFRLAPIVKDRRRAEAVIAFRDVTDLEDAEKMKRDFVSVVSHELRTPLTSIKGYLEALIEEEAGPLNEEQREYAEISYRNARRLEMLVGDLLMLSRLDSGRLEFAAQRFEIEPPLRQVAEELQPIAQSKGLRVLLGVEAGLAVVGDRLRIAQVVTNLASNAIKFSSPGREVNIRAHRSGEEVVVEVADQGVGIPASELPRLTERFFRASTAEGIQGTGLGLAITKEIVERHGGRLEVESEEGAGSAFRIVLPAAPEG